jgi:hypothetical protein
MNNLLQNFGIVRNRFHQASFIIEIFETYVSFWYHENLIYAKKEHASLVMFPHHFKKN